MNNCPRCHKPYERCICADEPATDGASGPLDDAAIRRGELRARIAFWRSGCRRVSFPNSRDGLPELEIDTGRVTGRAYDKTHKRWDKSLGG